jgi:hypothetical protein
VASTLGTVLVYAVVIGIIVMWYRVQCTQTGTCISSITKYFTEHSRPAQAVTWAKGVAGGGTEAAATGSGAWAAAGSPYAAAAPSVQGAAAPAGVWA